MNHLSARAPPQQIPSIRRSVHVRSPETDTLGREPWTADERVSARSDVPTGCGPMTGAWVVAGEGPGLAVLPGLASWPLLATGVLCLVHPGVVMMTIRRARRADESELKDIDAATWTADVSPAPPPAAGAAFFGERTAPGDVLVAETDHVIAGYAALGQSGPLASHSHVLQIRGLAVHPARQHCGVGRRLVEACIELARDRGARKLSLRVLGGNIAARRLYESCGFTTEGTLREEFFLDGRYVDDVLMACLLDPAAGPEG